MKKSILVLSVSMLAGSLLVGQTPDEKTRFSRAEELRKSYNFSDAIVLYKEIYAATTDTSFQKALIDQIARSENGIKMLEYGIRPKVYGSVDVPLKDFYLYYPNIKDSTWILVPSFLNKNKRDYPIYNVMIHRQGVNIMYFSAQDKKGAWDIYSSQYIDGDKWTPPQLLNNIVNSPGDELFPVLSPDSKKLYFSSNGHYGMGGFDLYVSIWDDKTNSWGVPQNLGFPYSSPDDDYLFINSDDANYSIFASKRNISAKDSIRIYKLEFENTPVKSAITSTEEAIEISSLKYASDTSSNTHENIAAKDNDSLGTNPQTSDYTNMVKEVRRIQNEIAKFTKEINVNRALYDTLSNSDDKALLGKKISAAELLLLEQQSKLSVANQTIQEREMNFLRQGVLIPREDFFKDPVAAGNDTSAIKEPLVAKVSLYGALPKMEILSPVVPLDYTFKIQDESVIIADDSIPDGLVFSIQLFLLSEKIDPEALKGISPVFETVTPSGKFNYTAGRFYSYSELSSALARVRALRFPKIFAIAYHNGKSIGIKEARLLESRPAEEKSYQVKFERYPNGLPQPVLDLIRKTTDKDIAMKVVEGKTIYFVGPFSNKQEADQLVTLLSEIAEGVTTEAIIKEEN